MNAYPKNGWITVFMILILAWLRVVTAEASGSWPNEPAGLSVLVDCPFSGNLCPNMWDAYNSAAFVADPAAPLSPSGALNDYLAVNSTEGSGQWGAALPNAKELYVGTWWRTNSEFQGMCNNNNKMLFARNPSIDNNFLVWQGAPGAPKTFKWYMQAGYDNCGHPGEVGMCYSQGEGTGWFEPNVGSGTVAAGSGWHLIEFYLKSSTTKTSRDGAVKWWIDGRPVGSYNSVNLSPGGMSDFQINHTWDGTNCLLPPLRDLSKAWHHYWDHLHIAVGQGTGSSDQPPGPPAAPRISSIHVP
jgi:hypothetical protein